MKRSYERNIDEKRPVIIEPNYYDYAEGSCLIKFGKTEVLCVATVEESSPPHLRGRGMPWITGEYGMLPRSSSDRIRRERPNVSGRTSEIQRLIGRAMRSIVTMEGWGERTITLDCDVLRADGGTRTASITGAFIATVMALKSINKNGKLSKPVAFPVHNYMSAISVGIVDGKCVLDLDYSEDSTAETDMNLVMTSDGKIVEIQGTAEKDPFSEEQFFELLRLGKKGCQELCALQKEIVGDLSW